MSRRRIRQIVAIIVLVLVLALIGAAYVNYRTTRTLGIDIQFNQAELLSAPQYLYSFSGSGDKRMQRPIGVLATGGKVYVTDGRRSVMDVYTPEGDYITSWGAGKLVVPLYIARNPVDGMFYVSDRRKRSIEVFDENGKWQRTFDPKLPKNQLPKFKTGGVQWEPVAIAFAPDGAMYVTEILNGHRLLIFSPDGKFKRSVGTAGMVSDAKAAEGAFQFPNSVKVLGNEVWVADSNNRRIQVFTRAGDFKRFVVTQGLPRGFDFLPKLKKDEPARLAVVDTLAHDVTLWDAAKAEKLLSFGSQGVLEGQFNFPDDLSIDARRRIFITDTVNGRVQVWGWPATAAPVPTPTTPLGWLACLSPLLLLPLLLLLRRRRYVATPDFVFALYDAGEMDRMADRRVRWEVTSEDFEQVKELKQNGVAMADVLHPVEHSESDAKALQARYELDWHDAVIMSLAQRARLFGTEDPDLRRIARVLEVPVVDHVEFLARTSKRGKGGPTAVDPSTPETTDSAASSEEPED